VLGEFFASKADEIDDAFVEGGPYGRRSPTVEAKTISSVSIATLGEILGAGTYDDLFERIEGPQAASGEAGIDQVPDEVRNALASADDLDAIADRWAATEEMVDWEPADVREVVRDLSRLARIARDADHHIWFWWSL
jgi:hypothetical protein